MTTQTMTMDQLQAEIEGLRRANANLKATKAKNRMRVSEKGAVSVYSVGRFPVTLYMEQWEKILNMADDIRGFIADNRAALTVKSKAAVD